MLSNMQCSRRYNNCEFPLFYAENLREIHIQFNKNLNITSANVMYRVEIGQNVHLNSSPSAIIRISLR